MAGCGHVVRSSAGEREAVPEGPWLSILVPVYNVRPFVGECLDSIRAQMTKQPGVELIVVDDCSTDGSAEICAQTLTGSGVDARLLRHDDNRGISAARNTLLEAARGEYVWFVDSDDTLLPGALSALSEVVWSHRPDVILCDYRREKGDAFRTFCSKSGVQSGVPMQCTETLVAGAFSRRRLHAWSKIWRRELFGDTIRFPEGARFEDVATVPWLLLSARSFVYAAQPWIFYRTRKSGIMAQLNCRGQFDRQGNDDLAASLHGFDRALAERLPHACAKLDRAVSRFWAREFVKIVKRIARGQAGGWRALQVEALRYRNQMEASSPWAFNAVLRDYVRSGDVVRAGALALALTVSSPPRMALPDWRRLKRRAGARQGT